MTTGTLLAIALSALSARGSAARIQNGDTATVERAVAEYTARVLLAPLPPGAPAFDSQDENGHERSPERLRNLESILGGKGELRLAVLLSPHELHPLGSHRAQILPHLGF